MRLPLGFPTASRTSPACGKATATDAARKARAGRAVVSTGRTTVELPGRGGATTKVAIVRDPNNLFLVLLQAPRP